MLELDPTARIPSDILPMYGGMERDREILAAGSDAAFVAAVSKEFGSREVAAGKWVEQGLGFYHANDYERAMRRFNQAWILDPTNAGIFHGYAIVYQDHGNYLEAGGFAERALALGLKDARFRADCAYMIVAREGALTVQRGTPPSDDQVAQIRSRVESILSSAAADCSPADRGYFEWVRFRVRMLTAEYDKAWESVFILEELGEPAPPDMLRHLKSASPRPSGH